VHGGSARNSIWRGRRVACMLSAIPQQGQGLGS